MRHTRTQDRPASRHVNDHDRVSGTHTLDGEAVGRCHLVDEDGDIGPRHREPLYVGVVQGPVELTDEPSQRSNLSPEIVNVGL